MLRCMLRRDLHDDGLATRHKPCIATRHYLQAITIAHNYIAHNYTVHNCIGHLLHYITYYTYYITCHNFIGHNYIGHSYIAHQTLPCCCP